MAYKLLLDGGYALLDGDIVIGGGDDFTMTFKHQALSKKNYLRLVGQLDSITTSRVLIFSDGRTRLSPLSGTDKEWFTGVDISTVQEWKFERISGNLNLYLDGVLQSGGFSSNTDSYLFNRLNVNGETINSEVDSEFYFAEFEINGVVTNNFNADASGGVGAIIPDTVGSITADLAGSYSWVFYTPPVLGSHYLAFDGVNDWIRMANFTMPVDGIFSYSIDLQAYLSANTGAGVLLQFDSFSRLLMSLYTDTSLVSFDLLKYGGVREFTNIYVDFTEKLVINIEIDFDLNELRFYINNALIRTNTTFDFLAAYAGQVSTQHDFGNEFNARFLKCDLYEININNQLLYKNDESDELTYFPEIIQGAHATMFNFTLPDSWVFYSSGVQITGAFNMPFLSVLGNVSVTLPQPIANCEFEMPLIGVNGNISVTLPQPIIEGAFSMPFLGVNGSIQVGEITFTIERGTNINQKYFSANINQKYLSNTIIYN